MTKRSIYFTDENHSNGESLLNLVNWDNRKREIIAKQVSDLFTELAKILQITKKELNIRFEQKDKYLTTKFPYSVRKGEIKLYKINLKEVEMKDEVNIGILFRLFYHLILSF